MCDLLTGHGGGYTPPKCSESKIDAITTDDAGKTYIFAGKVTFTTIIVFKGTVEHFGKYAEH